jgi:hypothetical protein
MRAALRQAVKLVQPKPRQRPYNLGPTLNQGSTPQCVGYSCRHKLMAAPIMVKPELGLSEHEIYLEAQKRDEWPGENYDGSSVRGGFKFLTEAGYIKSYVFAATAAEARKFIRDGWGTVVLGTNWYAQMFYPMAGGVLPVPPRTATPVGGHAYHMFWTDATHDFFQNSWGGADEWEGSVTLNRQPGCFKMPHALTDRLMREDGEAGAGLEVKVKL